MKKNDLFTKTKNKIATLSLLVCFFMMNSATAQLVQTWTASANLAWADPANWSQTGLTFSTTAAIANNTALVTVASTLGLAVGNTVTGAGIPANTTIASIDANGTQFTMNNNVTPAVASGTALIFTFAAPLPGAVPMANDLAVLDNNTIDPPVITGSVTVARLNISNTVGTAAGPTFTIPVGTTFNCNSSVAAFITVAGGTIVNNGTLSISAPLMTLAAVGVNFVTPVQLPATAIEYGYSGTGHLVMNTPAVTTANSCVIQNNTSNANSTIKLLFDGTTDFILGATNAFVLAISQPSASSPVIVGGAGFTLGTSMAPRNGGLIRMSNFTNLTIDAGTTLNMYSAATNLSAGITLYLFNNAVTNTFRNRGTINILGTSQRSGIALGIDTPGLTAPNGLLSKLDFINENTINIDLTTTSGGNAALLLSNFGANLGNGTINLTNTATGTMNLKNNQPYGTNAGQAIRIGTSTVNPNLNLVNDGILNFTGSNINFGGQIARSIITNNASINSNFEFTGFGLTNSATGTISFVNPMAVTTKAATFVVPIATAVTAGDTYTDTNSNVHTITATKLGTAGTSITTHTTLAAVVPALGNLTRTSGTGTATITCGTLNTFPVGNVVAATAGATYTNAGNTYTVVTTKVASANPATNNLVTYSTVNAPVASGQTLTRATGTGSNSMTTTAASTIVATTTATVANQANALTIAVTNDGTVNTATGSTLLTVISGAGVTSANSTIAPGGSMGKGVASFTGATKTMLGTLKIQVEGNTAAGVDYDQIKNITLDGGFDIAGAMLDVTGISGVATPVDIVVANGIGTITGTFASVTGLGTGWSVDYSTTGKVQLIYSTLSNNQFSKNNFSYYPNPTRNNLNITSAKSISTVEFFNLLGQKVLSNKVNANQKELDLSGLQSGVYVMEVTIENSKESFKIVKQ